MSEATAQPKQEQLLREFDTIVSETEQLLKAMTPAGGASGGDVPAKVDENQQSARERLALLEEFLMQKAKTAAQSTESYVRSNPWPALGIAVGIGLVIGLLLKRR
jgi:ElaB/YqjD/DUF883 family membrane-anchored ribosome-binding protein